MNRAVRVRLLCLTLLLYAIQAQLWIWVLHKKPVFSKSLVATAAAAATPIARLLVSICICRMFPDREFNSIYKFYAFITINSRTMKPRLIPRSIAKSEAETDSNSFFFYVFMHFQSDKTWQKPFNLHEIGFRFYIHSKEEKKSTCVNF